MRLKSLPRLRVSRCDKFGSHTLACFTNHRPRPRTFERCLRIRFATRPFARFGRLLCRKSTSALRLTTLAAQDRSRIKRETVHEVSAQREPARAPRGQEAFGRDAAREESGNELRRLSDCAGRQRRRIRDECIAIALHHVELCQLKSTLAVRERFDDPRRMRRGKL